MSNFEADRWLKGAIVVVDAQSPTTKSTIVFQYNPATLTRRLNHRTAGAAAGAAGKGDARRVSALLYQGAPQETINLDIEIDAIDLLGSSGTGSLSAGIHPQLAALEMLLYPLSREVTKADSITAQGQTEIISGYAAPYTLFVWGPKRVLPVQITSFDITEEQFDSKLNPIRATVKLGLQVLSYSDLMPTHPGYNLFLAYQKQQEQLAAEGGKVDKSRLGADF